MGILGISGSRQRTSRPARADELAEQRVTDLGSGEVRLGDLWRDRPAVVVWLRHYG